jgi:hypothetical protein
VIDTPTAEAAGARHRLEEAGLQRLGVCEAGAGADFGAGVTHPIEIGRRSPLEAQEFTETVIGRYCGPARPVGTHQAVGDGARRAPLLYRQWRRGGHDRHAAMAFRVEGGVLAILTAR